MKHPITQNMTILACLAILSLLLPACYKEGRWSIRGKGADVTETRDLSGFNRIHLSIDGDISYVQGAVYRVEITGQENILSVLESKVQGKELTFSFRRNVWDHHGVKIVVHSPEINAFTISGSGNILVSDSIVTSGMETKISGSGNISIPMLRARSLNATISGSGNIAVSSGAVSDENFNISGSGDIKAEYVPSASSAVKISGSGNVSLNVTETLDVSISGSGDVRYKGRPAVNSNISGSGRLIHLN